MIKKKGNSLLSKTIRYFPMHIAYSRKFRGGFNFLPIKSKVKKPSLKTEWKFHILSDLILPRNMSQHCLLASITKSCIKEVELSTDPCHPEEMTWLECLMLKWNKEDIKISKTETIERKPRDTLGDT